MFSPREGLRADVRRAPDQASANLLLARWGLGVSFHEFEAALGDLSPLVAADGFDPPLCEVMPLTLEERLLFTYWTARGVTAPIGFVRENLFAILRKPGGSRPAPIERGLSAPLRPLPLEQVGVRGALMNWARREGVWLRQALGMAVPLSDRWK